MATVLIETRIARLVDLAHAAFAQLVEDSIRAEFSTDHGRVLDGLRRDASEVRAMRDGTDYSQLSQNVTRATALP